MDKNKAIEKAAEILVECGIGINVMPLESAPRPTIRMAGSGMAGDHFVFQEVDPFADTLECRRQADAIEDWFDSTWMSECDSDLDIYDLWTLALSEIGKEQSTNHQWRLDRIRWCLEQLAGDK